jgi:hypothetical protein
VSTFSLPKNYFAEVQEEAFIYLIDPQTSDRAKEEILQQVLYRPLYHLTESVAIRYAPCVGVLGEDELVSQAFDDLRKKYHKFTPWSLDKKTGKKVLRAFSYLSTVVKNFSLGYAKTASKYDADHQSFDAGAQERLEQRPGYQTESGRDEHREVARDQRMQRVLAAIKKELDEAPNLRPNDAAVGRALLMVLETSATQQEGWNDERITPHYLRRLLVQGVYALTSLGNKEINTGFRRFLPLYELVCRREDGEGEEAEEELIDEYFA